MPDKKSGKKRVMARVDADLLKRYKEMKKEREEGGDMLEDFGATLNRFMSGALRSQQ